ncbi:uncharacterized protein At4g15545-like [Impatiens glandulifera]|uniref:uncharacterized protein At4g15545-like n=1 Tax=Impatiens glandulifera TaxID=253017 RepID=UPI001FB0F231|nr:uncharacterized protein At4g15545-like [Impatiens glandulifera]
MSSPDFHIPDEVLAVIPTDPYEQLDLARKITSMAIASRVSNLELEVERLRKKVNDKDRSISELEDKVVQLDRACQEADTKFKLVQDDNVKLVKERDSLAMTARKLGRDLIKLETFKKHLMQSLNDDNSSPAETVDLDTSVQSAPRSYTVQDSDMNGQRKHNSLSALNGRAVENVSKQSMQRSSTTTHITPRLTPTGTPKMASTNVSPVRYSAAVSPQLTSGATSPVKSQHGSMSSWFPSSQQSSAANSPPRGGRPRGKEFFRLTRSRLSYEQFSAFLANIKEFNAQEKSKEETLRKSEEIFGIDNRDLYLSFHGLLTRNFK